MNLWFEEHHATTESLNLTIIGDLDPDFDAKIITKLKNGKVGKHLHILPPMSQMELHKSLALYDVGLALEFDDSDLNRQLCLTNKMLAYAQAGLYILATDTPAQKQFMQDHKKFGMLCGQTPEEIRDGLKVIMSQREIVRLHRHERFINAQEISWEMETEKLKTIINNPSDEKNYQQLT
jgi:glycosyltransferase involved in cell wall biosynthesis